MSSLKRIIPQAERIVINSVTKLDEKGKYSYVEFDFEGKEELGISMGMIVLTKGLWQELASESSPDKANELKKLKKEKERNDALKVKQKRIIEERREKEKKVNDRRKELVSWIKEGKDLGINYRSKEAKRIIIELQNFELIPPRGKRWSKAAMEVFTKLGMSK